MARKEVHRVCSRLWPRRAGKLREKKEELDRSVGVMYVQSVCTECVFPAVPGSSDMDVCTECVPGCSWKH